MEASEDLGLSQVTESSSLNATGEPSNAIEAVAGSATATGNASCAACSSAAGPVGPQTGKFTRIWHSLNSETCSIGFLVLLFINTIQLYLFFVYGLLVMPLHTNRMLRANNLEFIISQLPDSYIDYNFFESLSVL